MISRRHVLTSIGATTGITSSTASAHWHGGGAYVVIYDQELSDEISVRRAYLPDGGYVALHDLEEVTDGDYEFGLIGITDELPPDDHWNIDVPNEADWDGGEIMAIPYRDPSTPYTDGRKVEDFHTVNDTAEITVPSGYGLGGYGDDYGR